MIKNERQYRITKAQLDDLSEMFAEVTQQALGNERFRSLEAEGLRTQIADLRSQIDEYESLVAGEQEVLTLNSLDELPRALIKARIAGGLSQKDFAERLGLKEQQIQRYEATDYASASLDRILEVIRALGIRMREEIILPKAELSFSRLFTRLSRVGLDKGFVLSRLVPLSLRARIEDPDDPGDPDVLILNVAERISRVFGWTTAQLLGGGVLEFNMATVGATRYKTSSRVDVAKTNAYTTYAYYLAQLVLEATDGLPTRPIPTDPQVFRETIIALYGVLTFESTLRYVWSLGIPVLPLADTGAFHGACWRISGRNVIALKQSFRAPSRWLFDLVHETRHASENPDKPNFAVIEDNDIAGDRHESEEERAVNFWAGNVTLKGRAEALAKQCAIDTHHDIKRLKQVVKKVATQEGVSEDALANYLAYRLTAEGENWWPTANAMQTISPDPYVIARDMLLEHINIGALRESDRALLLQAITE